MKRHQHKRTTDLLEPVRTRVTPGMFGRHIIGKGEDKQREYQLHATKGYRSYRRGAA